MKKIMIASLLAAFVVGSVGIVLAEAKDKKKSQEDVFQQRDTDADGKLTLIEFKGKRQGEKATKATKKFEKMDANGDGSVTREEFDATKGKKGEKKNKAA